MKSWFSIQLSGFYLSTVFLTVCTVVSPDRGCAQQPPIEKPQPEAQQGGMSTRGAHAPVKDARARPITAGGFVDGAPVVFADITRAAGLDKFHHRSGSPDKNVILEVPVPALRCWITTTMAGWTIPFLGWGTGFLDYDDDGLLDIFDYCSAGVMTILR